MSFVIETKTKLSRNAAGQIPHRHRGDTSAAGTARSFTPTRSSIIVDREIRAYDHRFATVKYARTVIAYHGCDAHTAERLVCGEPFKKSQNEYDWRGSGIYFWEYGADRALRFAHDQNARGKVETPRSSAPLSNLGRCFD
jgi:hypothetical protein